MSTCWSARWYYKLTVSIRGYPCWQAAKADGYRIGIGYRCAVESYSCKYAASSASCYTIRYSKWRYWRYSQTTCTDYQSTCYCLAIGWIKFLTYFVSNKSASSWGACWYHDTSLYIGSYTCWQTAKGYRY